MVTITLQEAQTTLADLIRRLPAGEWVIITDNDKPVAQLIVPFAFARPACASRCHRGPEGRRVCRTPRGSR